ncbi:hypothetical protein QBC39DRAFT_373814 [Podospora conica]|nr:hypothetical protein QBC39DRAFT_373814 [Schizothecium conicum]
MLHLKRWLPGLRPFPLIPPPRPSHHPNNPTNKTKRQTVPTDYGHFLTPASPPAPLELWTVGETRTIRTQTNPSHHLPSYTVALWQNATLIRVLAVLKHRDAGSALSFDWIVSRSEPNVSAAVVRPGAGNGLYHLRATNGSNPDNQGKGWMAGFESVVFGIREGEGEGGNLTTTTTQGGLTTGVATTTSVIRTATVTFTEGVSAPTATTPIMVVEAPGADTRGATIGGSVGGVAAVALVCLVVGWVWRKKRRGGGQRLEISGPVPGTVQGTTLVDGQFEGGAAGEARLGELKFDATKLMVFEADGTPDLRGEVWGGGWPGGGFGGVGGSGEWMVSRERGGGPAELG